MAGGIDAREKCVTTGKVIYKSRREARVALNKIRERRPSAPERNAYNCRYCGKWHVTRMGEKVHRKPVTRMAPATRWNWNNGKPKER